MEKTSSEPDLLRKYLEEIRAAASHEALGTFLLKTGHDQSLRSMPRR